MPGGSGLARHPVDQVHLLGQPVRSQIVVADALVRFGAHLQGPFAIGQQSLDGAAEGPKVAGVIDQQAVVAVGDLILDTTDAAGHDWAGLHMASVTYPLLACGSCWAGCCPPAGRTS